MAEDQGLRRRVSALLDDDPLERTFGRRLVRVLLVTLIVASVGGSIIATMDGLADSTYRLISVVELLAVIAFTIEYAARLWTAVEDRDERYGHPFWGRLRFAATPMALIDLAAILPFYLGVFFNLDLVVLRLFRLLRILKITRYSSALTTFEVVIFNERKSLGSALIIILVLLVVAATLLYSIEGDVQPEEFGSVPAAMWWAVITLTTVGYGDVTPATELGKLVSGILAILGIGMFAIPTAILGAGFASELQKRHFIDRAAMVARVPAFKDLPPAQLAELTSLLKPREVPARYTVTRYGEMVDSVYFIDEGQVSFRGPKGRRIIEAGGTFGGIALLEGHAKEISAVTLTRCTILELSASDFHRLVHGDPDLRDAIIQRLRAHAE